MAKPKKKIVRVGKVLYSKCGFKNKNIYIIPREYKLKEDEIYTQKMLDNVAYSRVYMPLFFRNGDPVKHEKDLVFHVIGVDRYNVVGYHARMTAYDRDGDEILAIFRGRFIVAEFIVMRARREKEVENTKKEDEGILEKDPDMEPIRHFGPIGHGYEELSDEEDDELERAIDSVELLNDLDEWEDPGDGGRNHDNWDVESDDGSMYLKDKF